MSTTSKRRRSRRNSSSSSSSLLTTLVSVVTTVAGANAATTIPATSNWRPVHNARIHNARKRARRPASAMVEKRKRLGRYEAYLMMSSIAIEIIFANALSPLHAGQR